MRFKIIIYLMLLACMWGSSYLFVKIGVSEIPPLTFATGRAGLGALILYVVLRLQGRHLPKWGRIWQHIAVVALIHNAIPYVLVCWGGLYIDSGLAAIITGTTPLFTIVLAHFWVTDDRLTPTKLFGMLIGFAGLPLLILPALTSGVQATTAGILAVLLAALCYAVALIYSRKNLRGLAPLSAPAAQLMMATIYMLPLSFIVDQSFRLPIPSWPAIAALLAVSVMGTALGFIFFYRLVEIATPSYISTVSYLIPLVGVSLGVLVLGEQLAWNIYTGFAIILGGILIANLDKSKLFAFDLHRIGSHLLG